MSGNHRDKRRKVGGAPDQEHVQETFKLSTRFKPTQPREWTVSVAIPSSVIADCSSAEQRINSPSRIARALAVFSVDEVVIFDDSPLDSRPPATDLESYTGDTDPCHYIWHLLSYMETPPFMRKNLFPLHPNLRLQGLLPSLDMPHHPHRDEQLPYMEGMTLDRKPDGGKGTMVEIGMRQPIKINETIPPRTRVTLHFPNQSFEGAQPVHPTAPRTDGGYYWGYGIRKCSSISAVFTESPWEDGYDISIGTSERGLPASKAFPPGRRVDFKHLLIVFGGPRGLEFATMNDPELSGMGTGGIKTRELFDHWINVLPDQGSRAIRTDEAIFIALAELRRVWHQT